jgi:transposase-like protein
MKTQFNNLLNLTKQFPTENECREFLSNIRWQDKPVCVHCGSSRKTYKMDGGKLLKCADCRRQFSVRIGTIFEDSALPLQKWFMAIYLLMAHKKGISSIQLGKDIGVTQKTAWFMLHRIRFAVRTKSFENKLTGTIEADETYVGGQEKNKHLDKRTKGTQGRSTKTKNVIFGINQRDGIVAAETVERVNQKTIQSILKQQVSPSADIMTDEFNAYNGLDKHFNSHNRVDHSSKEYVRGNIHTQNIESFWAILKRGIFGIYHQVSKKHLDRYIDEFEFRFNSKHIKDIERFSLMLKSCNGRLMYKMLTNK